MTTSRSKPPNPSPFVRIERWMTTLGLGPAELIALAWLWGWSRKGTQSVLVSIGQLAKWCGVSEHTARRTVKSLEESGLVDTQRVAGAANVARMTDAAMAASRGDPSQIGQGDPSQIGQPNPSQIGQGDCPNWTGGLAKLDRGSSQIGQPLYRYKNNKNNNNKYIYTGEAENDRPKPVPGSFRELAEATGYEPIRPGSQR